MPLHTHDCKGCTFLGTLDNVDLYHCLQGIGSPALIARYSSDGPDYSSLSPQHAIISHSKHLKVAKVLAEELKLQMVES
jgi:hypothetical protein